MLKFYHKISLFLLGILLPLAFFASSPPPAHAQLACLSYDLLTDLPFIGGWIADRINGPWYNQNTCQFLEKVYDSPEEEIFGERYTFAQVNWIFNSLQAMIFPLNLLYQENGLDTLVRFISPLVYENSQPPTLAEVASLGPVGFGMGTMAKLTNAPPLSGVHYVKSLLSKFSLIKPVHAQGYGYTALSVVQSLWEASRNMVYLLMVIFLIAAGFLIIFRTKINPQTAISLQMMIPRVVITLLLVTFSYAIAGFVIDLMHVVLALIIASLPDTIISNRADAITYFSTPGFGKIFFYYFMIMILYVITTLPTIVGPLISIVIYVLIVFLLVKVWWMMLKTYVALIFSVIAAPWYILLGLLPNSKVDFSSWLRGFIANASVFVVIPLMFLLNIVVWTMPGGLTSSIAWAALTPYLGALVEVATSSGVNAMNLTGGELPGFPLMGSHDLLFQLGIGYVILALMPKAAEMVRDALKVPAFKYGSAIGESLGPITTPVGGGIQSWGTNYAKTHPKSLVDQIVGSTVSSIGGNITKAGRS